MNVTFLIGNGFDLACGLKSTYPDVYEEYIKQASQSEVIKKFKEDLIANKTKEKWGNWSDFEMGMAEYAKNFENEKDFIGCISDFKNFLRSYLIKEENRFKEDYYKLEKNFKNDMGNYIIEQVENFYTGITRKLERRYDSLKFSKTFQYKFITFNYTETLKMVLKNNSIMKGFSYNIYDIHGSIVNNDMILGADNINQVQAPFELNKNVKRLFIKPFLNEENDPEKVEGIKNLIQNSNCICIFGLSLGDSDLTWKNELVKWMSANKDNHVFIFDYECSKKSFSDLALKLNEEDIYKTKKMLELGIDVQEYFEQIHIPFGKQVFPVGAIMQAQLKEIEKKNKTA